MDTASLRDKVKLARSEKWRILKNIATVSFAFMVQFTAFQGTANLQSSINSQDSLGTISLASIYAALVVSCIFLPTLIIRKLTAKWTLCKSTLNHQLNIHNIIIYFYSFQYAVLHALHCQSVLSTVLYIGTCWYSCRFGSCTYVGFQSYLFNTIGSSICKVNRSIC